MHPIERRIPDNVGGTETLFDEAPLVGTVEFNDGLVAFGPSIATLFISQNLLPSQYSSISLGLTGIMALFGVSLLFIKPAYLSLSEWVKTAWEFRQRPTELDKNLATDGGAPIDGVDVTPEDDTRQVLGFKKLHPGQDAVERTDGTMVSAIQFTGANMDTSDGDTWENAISQFANFANTQLRNDVQIYLPMRRYDPTDQVNMYADRQGDPDIAGNPVMEDYLDDRMGWMHTIGVNSYVREYYAVIAVTRAEVFDQAVNEDSGASALDNLPGGDYIKDFAVGLGLIGNEARVMSKREIKARQLRELERRRKELKTSMAVGLDNDAEVVEADDLGVLLKEFWEGVSLREDEGEGYVRDRNFVVGEQDKQAAAQREAREDGDDL